MKFISKSLLQRLSPLLAITSLAFAAPGANCGCDCCKDKPAGAACCCNVELAQPTAVKSHPLRGVVTKVQPESSSLMVKHEAIPGVMRAMTMLFKVDPGVVGRIKLGETITAKMSRVNDEWRLDDVRVVPADSK